LRIFVAEFSATLPRRASRSNRFCRWSGTNLAQKSNVIILVNLLGLFSAAAALTIRELWRAPEGYEDQTGFHVVRKTAAHPEASRFRTSRREGDASEGKKVFIAGKHIPKVRHGQRAMASPA
jgi:hypothetical protein